MLTQHKITVIYKHKTHMIQLVCSMNNIYSYKLSKKKKFKLISHFLFKFSLYLHIYFAHQIDRDDLIGIDRIDYA